MKGTIYTKTATMQRNNEGDIVPDNSLWGAAIPCTFKQVKHQLINKDEQAHEKTSYEILIQKDIDANMVKLLDSRGKELGQFKVISIQHLEIVKKVKIII